MVRQIEKLEKELKYIIMYSLKLKAKIREIKKEIADIEYAINLLGKEYKDLVRMKYRDKKSFKGLYISKGATCDRRNETVEAIAKLLNGRL
ncbi:hypothetical protein KQI89_04455 [Clostridium sp. MSJ-4]|uniref:Phage protein n=1 Tax=Clostridium simiarum TaxID=2841506 RepID=A0ABS6EXQ8_9CLOT|nr:hypothetical protein [Clostridium simiarum]MBU5591006.1 hypothetical protein [Clostridium simiarum]